MNKKIYIGVCKTRNDRRFLESLINLTDSLCGSYEVEIDVVENKFLPDSQNEIADRFLKSGFDYLLFLDDDHWGHTKDMVDCLVGADAYMATMRTYSRHYPYMTALYRKMQNGCVTPIEYAEGYVECDLTGFPMTLLKRELFEIIDRPFFRPVEAEGRDWNTDIEFCDRILKFGIKPIGCFQHILSHDKITASNVNEYRFKERMEKNNIAWFKILQEQGASHECI